MADRLGEVARAHARGSDGKDRPVTFDEPTRAEGDDHRVMQLDVEEEVEVLRPLAEFKVAPSSRSWSFLFSWRSSSPARRRKKHSSWSPPP